MMKLNFKLMFLLGLTITFSLISCDEDDNDTSDQNIVLVSDQDITGQWNLQNYSIANGAKGVDPVVSNTEESNGGEDIQMSYVFGFTLPINANSSDFSISLNSDGNLTENGSFDAENATLNSSSNGTIRNLKDNIPVGSVLASRSSSSDIVESLFADNVSGISWSLVGVDQLNLEITTPNGVSNILADILFVGEDVFRISLNINEDIAFSFRDLFMSEIAFFNEDPEVFTFVQDIDHNSSTIVQGERVVRNAVQEIFTFTNSSAIDEGDIVFVEINSETGMPERDDDDQLIIPDSIVVPASDVVIGADGEITAPGIVAIIPSEQANHTDIAIGNDERPTGTLLLTFAR